MPADTDVTVFDLWRICNECEDGYAALHRFGTEYAQWRPLVQRLCQRHEQPLSREDFQQSVPSDLVYAFLASLPLTVYENPYDGVLRDERRRAGDTPVSLAEVFRRYGHDSVYKVLEAGGYCTFDAPLAESARLNRSLVDYDSWRDRPASNDEPDKPPRPKP